MQRTKVNKTLERPQGPRAHQPRTTLAIRTRIRAGDKSMLYMYYELCDDLSSESGRICDQIPGEDPGPRIMCVIKVNQDRSACRERARIKYG
jgi:hypothetical protein